MVGGHCTLKPAGSAGGDRYPRGRPARRRPRSRSGASPIDPPVLGVAADALVIDRRRLRVRPVRRRGSRGSTSRRASSPAPRSATSTHDGGSMPSSRRRARTISTCSVVVRALAGFQLVRVDTASEVTTITLGDYDGNGITDIAYTEQRRRPPAPDGRVRHAGSPARSGRGRRRSTTSTSVVRARLPRSASIRTLGIDGPDRRCSRLAAATRRRSRCCTAARSARCCRTSIRGPRRLAATRRCSAAR